MPFAQSQIFLALACHSLYSDFTVNQDRTFGEVVMNLQLTIARLRVSIANAEKKIRQVEATNPNDERLPGWKDDLESLYEEISELAAEANRGCLSELS
jgi:hypothetical protein